MKRAFVYLFVVLALLLAPVAHAACLDNDCPITEQSAQKQDDGKLIDGGHHCFHIVADRTTTKTVYVPLEITSALIPAGEINLVSVIVGPLLEPPSFA